MAGINKTLFKPASSNTSNSSSPLIMSAIPGCSQILYSLWVEDYYIFGAWGITHLGGVWLNTLARCQIFSCGQIDGTQRSKLKKSSATSAWPRSLHYSYRVFKAKETVGKLRLELQIAILYGRTQSDSCLVMKTSVFWVSLSPAAQSQVAVLIPWG
jgi:hypothetical protein